HAGQPLGDATKAARGRGRVFPSAARRFLNLLSTEGRGYPGVVHEEDLSIKCVQSAVSESKTTRAARSRECAASSQCGGSVASDSSVARGPRPSSVRNPTQT